MPTRPKYLYYFPTSGGGSLFKHFHLYRRTTDLARRNGLPIHMVGFVPLAQYLEHRGEIKAYSSRDDLTLVVTPAGGIAKGIFIYAYFLLQLLLNGRVVVHARKVPVQKHLAIIGRIVGDRFKFVVELEGDSVMEAEYAKGADRESLFYAGRSVEQVRRAQRSQIVDADHVITITPELRRNLIERYPDLDLENRITALTTDFPETAEYSSNHRRRVRNDLGVGDEVVFTYLGSAAPVWQKVDRTIEIFDMLSGQLDADCFLLLLVQAGDHDLVESFIDRVGIPSESYHLTEVSPDEVRPYLHASDIGVMLRWMGRQDLAVFGAKYLDYLGAGLPVLATRYTKWADELRERGYGVVLDDIDDDEEIRRKFDTFDRYPDEERHEIAEWARAKFDVDDVTEKYVDLMIAAGEGAAKRGSS